MAEMYPTATAELLGEMSRKAREPAWLSSYRERAFASYRALEFETHPLFTRYVERPRDLAAAPPRVLAADPPRGTPPEGAGGSYELADRERVSNACMADHGLVFLPLSQAVSSRPDLAEALLSAPLRSQQSDKTGSLARAMAQNGVVVHVPDGLAVDQPLLVRLAPAGGAVFARVVLSLGRGARASVAVELAPGTGSVLAASLEAHVGEGASLDLSTLQTGALDATTLAGRDVSLSAHARVSYASVNVGGSLAKDRLLAHLDGRGSSFEGRELAFGSGEQRVDSTVQIVHRAAETTSHHLSKGAHAGRSRSYLKGLITIENAADESDSYLGQYAMLLSRESRCIAIPSLEIESKNVRRAKHAAAVAKIDDEQVFYLQSRGLDRAAAARAIVRGFLDPTLERVAWTPWREAAGLAIDRRLVGG